MKFRNFVLILPLIFMVAACAKKSDSADTLPATDSSALGGSPTGTITAPPAPGPSGSTGVTTPPVGTTDAAGCPLNPLYANPYSYYVNGTGTGTVNTTANQIMADSKLRVSITPSSAGGTAGTGGTMNYTLMSATITLLDQNGAVKGSVDIPGPSGSAYTSGIPVGKTSLPSIADFSSFLSGSGKYSIRVSNVRTDYKCNAFCTTSYYSCFPATYGYCYYGYSMNWDYHTNSAVCCYGSIDYLNQCQRQQCGVGTMPDNGNWSLTVKVETDVTGCIK